MNKNKRLDTRRFLIALSLCIALALACSTYISSRIKLSEAGAELENTRSKLQIAISERKIAEEMVCQWKGMYALSVLEIARLKSENEELTRRWEEVSFAYDEVCEKTGWSGAGEFRITHYCTCSRCCGSSADGITATGTVATAGRTVAVDPSVIPLGSKVLINGVVYIAEDTGSGIKGNRIDLFVGDHDQALAMGTYETNVMWK